MRAIDADVLKRHIDKLPALPDGNFAGNHSALKALINMQPTIEPSTNNSEIPNSSDTISRQDAKDMIKNHKSDFSTEKDYRTARACVNAVPPARPERIKGHWIKISPANIYECSECGKSVMTNDICAYDFCHGCGAEMEVTE